MSLFFEYYMKKILLFLTSLVILSCASHDKHNKHYYKKIEPNNLKKDVAYVKKKLTKMHPDLYWYISKENLDKKFDSLANSLNQPLTPNEFFLKISPVVASVHQGHMSMSMYSLTSPDSLKKKYKKSTNPLENLEYEYLENRLFIKRNKSDKDSLLQVGTEILDINGVSPQKLYDKYRKTFTSDGYNQTAIPKFFARRANSFYISELGFVDSVKLNVTCADTAFYYTLKRTFKKGKEVALNKEKESKNTQTDTIQKLTKKEEKLKKEALNKKQKSEYRKKEWYGYDTKTKLFSKEVSYPVSQDSTIAVLKIRDFVEGKVKVYDTIFSEFKKNNVQNLIIDLRGNPGGRINDVYRLSQYLNDSKFAFTQPATITNRTTFFNAFKGRSVAEKIFAAPFLSIYATVRGISAKRDENNVLKLPLQSSKYKEPKALNYKNKIYVITDGMTFSAAALISSHLKGRNRAFFVGNETGGTFNGTVAGIMPVVKLPNSKLKVRIGLMTIKPFEQTTEEGFGVKPDVQIKPTIKEFIDGTDPELNWILQDIKQQKSTL